MNLLSELRRRNVFRVALFYVVSAWLLVQVAETVLPVFGVPDVFVRGIIVVLLLGFVPVLIFAWVFELTPEGIRRESAIAAEGSRPKYVSQKLNVATLIIAVLAIGLLAGDRFLSPPPTAAVSEGTTERNDRDGRPARSIAVLAFDDLSPQADQAYFADGISEELLNLLARIDTLKVAARTSSFKYKGSQTDIADIGRELNVDTVLEGSVRKAGDQLRITAQLIDARSGFHMWSESFDRRLDNVFAVQDEIAQAIVDQLRLEFDVEAATSGRTRNEAAYDRYLQGRSLVREPSRANLLRAIDLFEQALEIDADFAAAWSGIADAWLWLEDYGGFSGFEAYPNAERAARMALALDPDSGEALATMGRLQSKYYDDPIEAESYFRRAIAANPSFVPVYSYYSDALRELGRMLDSIEMNRQAVDLDPLSRFARSRLAGRLLDIAAVDEASSRIEAMLREDPNDAYALEELANLHLYNRAFAEAAKTYRIVHFARPGDPYSASRIAEIGAYMNEPALIEPWIEAARDQGAENRWELMARVTRARWAGDTEDLSRVADLYGGETEGLRLQAVASIRENDYTAARPQLIGALRLASYELGSEPLTFDQIRPLIDLAFVEKQVDLRDWRSHADLAMSALERFAANGSIGSDTTSVPFFTARAAVVLNDPERALDHLAQAIANGFHGYWFLDHDPVFAPWREDPRFLALVEGMLNHAAEQRAMADLEGLMP